MIVLKVFSAEMIFLFVSFIFITWWESEVDVIRLVGHFFYWGGKRERPLTAVKGKFPLMSRAGVSELYIGQAMLKMTSGRQASLPEVNSRSVIKLNSAVNDVFLDLYLNTQQ